MDEYEYLENKLDRAFYEVIREIKKNPLLLASDNYVSEYVVDTDVYREKIKDYYFKIRKRDVIVKLTKNGARVWDESTLYYKEYEIPRDVEEILLDFIVNFLEKRRRERLIKRVKKLGKEKVLQRINEMIEIRKKSIEKFKKKGDYKAVRMLERAIERLEKKKKEVENLEV